MRNSRRTVFELSGADVPCGCFWAWAPDLSSAMLLILPSTESIGTTGTIALCPSYFEDELLGIMIYRARYIFLRAGFVPNPVEILSESFGCQ